MKLSKRMQEYVRIFINRVDIDALRHEASEIANHHGALQDYANSVTELNNAIAITEEIIGYMIGDIGIKLDRAGKYNDADAMDDAIYGAYRDGIAFAKHINEYIGTGATIIDEEFFVTEIFATRFRDDNSIDYTVPFDYEAYVERTGQLKTDYPELYNRILNVCITGEGANGLRFKRIADRFKRTVQSALCETNVSDFHPYVVTPYKDLIGVERTRLISEIMCCMAALGEYNNIFSCTGLTDEEIRDALRPMAIRIAFLRYCYSVGGVTQDLIDEFNFDTEGFVQTHKA